jgi:hypothetical protein
MRFSIRTCALLAASAGVTALLGAPPAAAAAGPLLGDVNGDGRVDQVVLGASPAGCSTTVRLGQPDGTYGDPVTRAYVLPDEDYADCPDLGVLVDLGGDGVVEVVVTFFYGTNGGPELLVLRDWTPAGGFRGQAQPSGIGAADFNGDGLLDVWELTDQGDGFSTFLNTPDGRLERGPLSFSSVSLFRVAFDDFDRDGATDVLAYAGDFEDGGIDVLVGYGDGRTVALHHWNDEFDSAESAAVVDANGDALPDVRITEYSGEEELHTGRGDGTFRLSAWGSPAITVSGVRIGATYGDSAALTPAWTAPGAASATLDGATLAPGTAIPLRTLALGEHRLVVTAETGQSRTVLFDTTTSFRDLATLLDRFRADGRVTASAYASLRDRLVKAEARAAAGNEIAAMDYLTHFVDRARNQVKGDAADLAARDVLIRDAQALIAEQQELENAENAG